MLYLDYAKKMDNGCILNFFADSEQDISEVSDGKSFVTKNGSDYGVPLASSTVVITEPDKTKKTYVLSESGSWELGGSGAGSSVEANVATTESDQELTSLQVGDTKYRIPTPDNVLVLQGVMGQDLGSNPQLEVTVSSYEEGEAIIDRYLKGDIVRVSYDDFY